MGVLEAMEMRHDYQRDASGSALLTERRAPEPILFELLKEEFSGNAVGFQIVPMKQLRPEGAGDISPLSIDLVALYSGGHRNSFLFFPLSQDADFDYQRPLEVSIVKGSDYKGYIAQNEELNKFAIGETEDEALLNFEDHLVSDFKSLASSRADELTPDAKSLLARYNQLFRLHASTKAKRD